MATPISTRQSRPKHDPCMISTRSTWWTWPFLDLYPIYSRLYVFPDQLYSKNDRVLTGKQEYISFITTKLDQQDRYPVDSTSTRPIPDCFSSAWHVKIFGQEARAMRKKVDQPEHFFSVWPIFFAQSDSRILNVYFMKTANILVYGYITVYGYVLNY